MKIHCLLGISLLCYTDTCGTCLCLISAFPRDRLPFLPLPEASACLGWSSRSSGWEQSCLTAGILFYSWDLLRYSGFFQVTIGNPTDIFQNQGPVRGPVHSTCPNPGTQNSLLRIISAQLCIPTEALWPQCSIVPVVVVAKTSQEQIIPASQGKASMEMCLTSVSLHLPLCI